jgi:hypothetical protein
LDIATQMAARLFVLRGQGDPTLDTEKQAPVAIANGRGIAACL